MQLPPLACDCHTHLAGDAVKYPMWSGRTYTPPAAHPEDLAAMHRDLGFERVVLVQASIHGTDNSVVLDGLRTLGPNARAVVVIDERTPDSDLDDMHRQGVRGIRLNLTANGQNEPNLARQLFREAAARLRHRDWLIQIFTSPGIVTALKDLIAAAPMPVVIDHFGDANAALGIGQAGFSDLLELVRSGKAYAKISCAYRVSGATPDYADVGLLVQALVEANPERVLWGSDWPHVDSNPSPGRTATDVAPNLAIDDEHMLSLFAAWVPDESIRRKILVDNPARIFGF